MTSRRHHPGDHSGEVGADEGNFRCNPKKDKTTYWYPLPPWISGVDSSTHQLRCYALQPQASTPAATSYERLDAENDWSRDFFPMKKTREVVGGGVFRWFKFFPPSAMNFPATIALNLRKNPWLKLELKCLSLGVQVNHEINSLWEVRPLFL